MLDLPPDAKPPHATTAAHQPHLAVPAPDRTWPLATRTLLHDVARCLALVDLGRLGLDPQGRLLPGSLAALASALDADPGVADPRSEAQVPAISFLLGLLGQAGFVAAVGASLRLATGAHHWLGSPPSFQVAQLREVWWLSPEVNSRWLPSDRSQDRLYRRNWRLILEMARWVAALPATQWMPVQGLYTHLAELDLIDPAGPSRNLARSRQAMAHRALALVNFLLRCPLPSLGLIETRTLADQLALRPSPDGAAWLRAALERSALLAHPPEGMAVERAIPVDGPRLPLVEAPAVVVGLSGPIPTAAAGQAADSGPGDGVPIAVYPHAAALCTFEIAHFARLLSPHPPASFYLTAESLQQALAAGYPVAEILFLLSQFTAQNLAPSVVDLLTGWAEEMTLLTCEPGYRLHTIAPAILDALRQRDPFRRRTAPLASGQDAWVGYSQAHELFRYLRRTGYILQNDSEGWQGADGQASLLPLSLHRPFPLSQLLVVLRTYERLRRLVPGLAIVDLQGLAEDIARSLLPEDLAAADRLVQSHATFLKHHLQAVRAHAGTETEEQSGRTTPEPGPPAPRRLDDRDSQHLDDLEARLAAAIDAGVPLDLTYADTQGQTTRRRVQPLHLETRWDRRYLLAYCELRQDERHFRLDRIVEVKEQMSK
jgi:hypothetical protein